MDKWQQNETTIPPEATPQGEASLHSNESDAEEIEGQVRWLTGLLLTQTSYLVQYVDWQQSVERSNWVTPVMVVLSQYEYWAMASHIMSTCVQLRTLTSTWTASLRTSQSRLEIAATLDAVEAFINETDKLFQ